MSRFFITLTDAVLFVLSCLKKMDGGEIYIPKMNSIYIEDLIKIINSKARITIIGKRPGEKIHETLFTGQESNLIYEQKGLYLIYPENISIKKRAGKRLSNEFQYVSNSKENLNISRIKKLIIDSKVLLLN
jgi:UDP-N-acetylglucosamine 4,6-dehydratase